MLSAAALLEPDVEVGESDLLRRVGRSGSPEDPPPEGGGLADGEDEVLEAVLSWLALESLFLKCGRPFPLSVTTWGGWVLCLGLTRLGGVVIGFHEP